MSRMSGRQGLIWVGGQFYKRPEDCAREAMQQGVSRRLSQLPKDFKLGETWVFVAHREAISESCPDWVFHAFKPSAVEYVVKGTETDEELERLEKRGLTPVRVQRVEDQTEIEPEPDLSEEPGGEAHVGETEEF